jgi:protease-4
MNQKRTGSHAGFWIGIGILVILLTLSLAFNAGFLVSTAGRDGLGEEEEGEDEFPSMTETWSYGSGETKAARIALTGPIFRNSEETLFGVPIDKIELTLRQIRAARGDEDVRAIVFEVDSPGGDLTASDEIRQALLDFKRSDEGRKVVVFVRDMAASGGYYISTPADWLIAEPTAVIGSIGVILQTLNLKGLSEKIGVTDTTIKSGANKDLLNPFHDVPPEQIALLQDLIDRFYRRFFDIVLESRGMKPDELRSIADGRILAAEDALQSRLIDQLGYWEDAVAKTAELLGEESVKIVRYEHRPRLLDLLYGIHLPLRIADRLGAQTPRFMYLWRP